MVCLMVLLSYASCAQERSSVPKSIYHSYPCISCSDESKTKKRGMIKMVAPPLPQVNPKWKEWYMYGSSMHTNHHLCWLSRVMKRSLSTLNTSILPREVMLIAKYTEAEEVLASFSTSLNNYEQFCTTWTCETGFSAKSFNLLTPMKSN